MGGMAGGGSGMGPSDIGGGSGVGMLGGPSSIGGKQSGMSPMPPTGMGPSAFGYQGPQPFSGMGTSAQTGNFGGMPPQPIQPPNPGGQQTGSGPSMSAPLPSQPGLLGPPVPGPSINGTMPPSPIPTATSPPRPVPTSGPPPVPTPTNGPAGSTSQVSKGMQNKMTTHNPTGIGADVASQTAAVKRPIPGVYPKKAQGPLGPPSPMNIPGKPA